MKKILLAIVLLSLCQVSALYAYAEDSEFYYYSVHIERIYNYHLGYIVVYRVGRAHMAHAYIPHDWFTFTGGRAERINIRRGMEWPSMTVYYQRGVFSHVRIRVRELGHQTWGIMPPNSNLDNNFQNLEEIKLEF